MKTRLRLLVIIPLLSGCTMVRTDVFPKFEWYWSKDAKMQQESDARAKAYDNFLRTNAPTGIHKPIFK